MPNLESRRSTTQPGSAAEPGANPQENLNRASEAPASPASAADLVTNAAQDDQQPPASFELALSELEAIVARMESGELTLENSLTEYRRGTVLLQYCQTALKDAQQQIKILEAGVLKDFSGVDDNG